MQRIIFLHGWTNRRPEGHWMRVAAAALREEGHRVWYPQFPNPEEPVAKDWQELLVAESGMMDEVGGGEKIAVAHSLGCVNWLHAAARGSFDTPFDRVLFVAPPDPELLGEEARIDLGDPVIAAGLAKYAKKFTMVSSDADHWLPRGIQETYEKPLGHSAVIVPGAVHFSLENGWGEWAGLIKWLTMPGADREMLRQK